MVSRHLGSCGLRGAPARNAAASGATLPSAADGWPLGERRDALRVRGLPNKPKAPTLNSSKKPQTHCLRRARRVPERGSLGQRFFGCGQTLRDLKWQISNCKSEICHLQFRAQRGQTLPSARLLERPGGVSRDRCTRGGGASVITVERKTAVLHRAGETLPGREHRRIAFGARGGSPNGTPGAETPERRDKGSPVNSLFSG